jgi:hypothetical protein
MARIAKRVSYFLAAATLLVFCGPALAASQRTFVASNGNDLSPCSISQPCRSFGAAIAKTSADGEVLVLDSAGYGPFTISQAVSVIAPPGIYAGISVSSGPGISVNAGAFDIVVLRNLVVIGQGGTDGIVISSGKQVHIEDCTISGMLHDGVYVPGGNYIRIANTLIRSNGLSGVHVPTANEVTVAIENTRSVHNNQVGYYLQGGSQIILYESSATDNAGSGVAYNANAGFPNVVIVGGEYSGNGNMGLGLFSDSGAFAGLAIRGMSASRNFSNGLLSQAFVPPGGPFSSANASITHSHVTWNGDSGLRTGSDFGLVNHLVISHSVFSENGVWGINANGGPESTVHVHYNSVSRNGDFDFAQTNSGAIYTFGTNALTGNPGGTEILGTLSPRSPR